ncbi:MDR family MFS transporter [Lacticaseibacillus zhaodongensis]|uniref:MDR family MFS transporter n=1 Tax=Lacticaseibacillus zhaodongensis TaxID=2668065 RepID=UPI0012D32767|nr:MDR family MFS transporter [Lacticaseibacillus zhaodongensis]
MSKKRQTNVPVITAMVFIATFMAAIEGTIVSTAMPTILGALHGVSLMNWVFTTYLLTSAMATPIYGKMADRIGRKPVLLVGLAIFVLGSLLSGLSQSMLELIIFRAIQGIGAGAIMPVTFTIIADMYPIEKRARVLGFNGSAWGIASVTAPLIGGFIVDRLSWHWVFIINVPIGVITMLLTQFYMHENFVKTDKPVDILGTIYLALTLLFLLMGFQMLDSAHGPLLFALLLVLTAGMLALFVRQEGRAQDPIISLKLFKSRTFTIQNVMAALVSGVVMGHEVYIPMWMQGILGLSASLGGFAVTPSSLMWIVGSFIAGRMIVNMVPRRVLSIALLIILVGIVAIVLLPQTTPYVAFLAVSAVLGTGFGISITTTTVTSQAAVEKDQVGVATSVNTLSRTLGQTIMVAIFGIIFNMRVAAGTGAHPGLNANMMNKLVNPQTATQLAPAVLKPLRTVLFSALHTVYVASAIVVVLAIVINLFDRKQKQSAD